MYNYTNHPVSLWLFAGVGLWYCQLMWITCIIICSGDCIEKPDDAFTYPPHAILKLIQRRMLNFFFLVPLGSGTALINICIVTEHVWKRRLKNSSEICIYACSVTMYADINAILKPEGTKKKNFYICYCIGLRIGCDGYINVLSGFQCNHPYI